ncbi:MAG: SDR family oxidoreductase [Rhizobiaceae bacterium]|nr:SDR family oxidoreductase [Rhizobiaceae bacterium]
MSEAEVLEGKSIVVTGAGNGIGRAIALLAAKHGASVVVNDLGASVTGEGASESPAEETVKLIEAEGGKAVANTDSVAGWDSARRIVDCAIDTFGSIDAVVNNAGILRDSIFHKMTEDQWRAVVDVHLHGTFFVSRAAAEHFRRQENGAFVHMTSASGLVGAVGQANYAAAKLGIASLSKSIAIEMKRYNVRSNCIAPVAWGRMSGAIPEDTPEQKERVARMKQITPEQNAPMAVFLASDRASHVTGQVFGSRRNELYFYDQTRLSRIMIDPSGWDPVSIAERAMPAFASAFNEPLRAMDVFDWDPQ